MTELRCRVELAVGGNFIHAPRTGDNVKISSLSASYDVQGRVGARRVL